MNAQEIIRLKTLVNEIQEILTKNEIEQPLVFLDTKQRRNQIYTVLPAKNPRVQKGQTVTEVSGTPNWLRQEFNYSKSVVQKDLTKLYNQGLIKRSPVKLGMEGIPNKVNTYIYYKGIEPQAKKSLFDQYVQEIGSEKQLISIIDVILNILPHKDPIVHNLKRDGKSNILDEVNWKLQTKIDKDLIYNLVDTLVSINVLSKSTERSIRYYIFYNNPEFNRSIYSKKDFAKLLKEKMGWILF